VDIRKGSPTYGKAATTEISSRYTDLNAAWLFVPAGFALGFLTLEDTLTQYLFTGIYNGSCEAAISPLSKDIDWSLTDPKIKKKFFDAANKTKLISEKDKSAMNLSEWSKSEKSKNFIYNV